MQTGGDIGPAVESTFQLPSRAHQHCGLTVELARCRSANMGLGSPLTPVGGDKGSLYQGSRKRGELSERPSVAGGLISQASRPLARHSWWAFEEDQNKGSFPVQAGFAVGGRCGKSPRDRDLLSREPEPKPKPKVAEQGAERSVK